MSEHYICTGTCKGVSDTAKTCDDQNCTKFNEPLAACNCEDGKHEGRQEQNQEKDQKTA